MVGAIIAIVAGLALAGGGTYVLVSETAPDNAVPFGDRPLANNEGEAGIVDYGRP